MNSRRALHCCNSDGHRPFLATMGSTGTVGTVALRDKARHAEAKKNKRTTNVIIWEQAKLALPGMLKLHWLAQLCRFSRLLFGPESCTSSAPALLIFVVDRFRACHRTKQKGRGLMACQCHPLRRRTVIKGEWTGKEAFRARRLCKHPSSGWKVSLQEAVTTL